MDGRIGQEDSHLGPTLVQEKEKKKKRVAYWQVNGQVHEVC